MHIAVITGPDGIPQSVAAMFSEAAYTFCDDPAAVPQETDAVMDLDFSFSAERITALQSFLPRPVLVNSVLHTLNEIQVPFTRFNGWPGLMNMQALEVAGDISAQAKELFDALKWNYVRTPDIPGFTSARVVCMIINEAYFAFDEGVSSKEEIDVAMKLGTNYPHGPFAWCNIIGVKNVFSLLEKLAAADTRYTPAPGLINEANKY